MCVCVCVCIGISYTFLCFSLIIFKIFAYFGYISSAVPLKKKGTKCVAKYCQMAEFDAFESAQFVSSTLSTLTSSEFYIKKISSYLIENAVLGQYGLGK